MNKEELLQELSASIGSGEISREEVMAQFDGTSSAYKKEVENTNKISHLSITKMLYVLGATVVVIGIVIFVGQIWNDIGSFNRILITLGFGLTTAAIGSVLIKQKAKNNIGLIFHFIGGMLIPGGAVVTIGELNGSAFSLWPFVFAFGVIFVFYLLLNSVHKNAVLTFFAIANGTAFLYFFVGAIIGELYYRNGDLYAYLTMVIGASYLLLAQSFREGWNKGLTKALHFVGSIAFLGAAFSQILDSGLWQILYFFIVVGGLFLAVYMKSRSILVINTIFLITYISYITSEYFANSIGWPLSLVILGFVFIGIGYTSIRINKEYIQIGKKKVLEESK